MSELKPRITENGIDYILVGDYYIPDLKLPEEHRPIGKYGRMHREYLREVHPARLNTLILTEELKRTHQMEWVVQRCNNIHNRAEEIVLHEMDLFIYLIIKFFFANLENTKFVASELSLTLSLVLHFPIAFHEP